MEGGPFAKLKGKNFEFYMTKRKVVIGRNSKLGDVDLNMGSTRFISRRHLEIVLDRNFFYFMCRGKNGVFVDDIFQRRENRRLQLPNSCVIRFPSTTIKFTFVSLLNEAVPAFQPMHSPALPLKVESQFCSPFVSPAPSPTGTISAINSCPGSPNSDFRIRVPAFDLNEMASYASRLLSTQQHIPRRHHQPQPRIQTMGENQEGRGGASSAGTTSAVSGDQCHPSNGNGEAPPTSMGMTEIQEENEEDDEEVEGGDSLNSVAESEAAGLPSGLMGGGAEKSQQKPPYSYAQLIVQALLAAKDHRQTLSSIYSFISDMYPYYKMEDKGWKNSIRHNLSLNQYFMKAPREKEGLGFGKGGYWCMHPDYEDKLTSQAYVKRKKKGIPVFPSSHLISSRSAPPSPTHHPPSDLQLNSLKEMTCAATVETPRLTLPLPPSTSHFTLNTYFPNLPQTVNFSHSLPASPSRIPAAETRSILGVRGRDAKGEDDDDQEKLPTEKKSRLEENLNTGIVKPRPIPLGAGGPTAVNIPATTLSSLGGLVSLPQGISSIRHGAPPPGLQFIPISLTAAATGLANQQRPTLPPPNMQLAPHPFLSGYFNCGTQAVPLTVPVSTANPSQANPSPE